MKNKILCLLLLAIAATGCSKGSAPVPAILPVSRVVKLTITPDSSAGRVYYYIHLRTRLGITVDSNLHTTYTLQYASGLKDVFNLQAVASSGGTLTAQLQAPFDSINTKIGPQAAINLIGVTIL